MNPAVIRTLAAFGGGALVGSVATFFITKSVVQKAERAIADAEIASVREHFRIIRTPASDLVTDDELAALEAEEESRSQGRGTAFDHDAPVDEERLRELAEAMEDAGYEEAKSFVQRVDSEKMSLNQALEASKGLTKRTVTVTEESIFDKALEEGPDGKPRDRTKPYIIAITEFAQPDDEFLEYENVEINYFAGDNIMLDSKEEIMWDVAEVIGYDNLQFGHLSEDEDIVYVRNEQISMVFEIHRHEVGYAASKGLNVDPEEEDSYKARRRQRSEDPDS